MAITLGATSLRTGSVPIARMASTCSVTSMEPSSEAIPVAQRPVTSNPVSDGPNSRTKAMATTSPVSEVLAEASELRPGLQDHDRANNKNQTTK